MKTLVWICSVVMLLMMPGIRPASAETYVHPETGIVFPDRIAGMEKGTLTDYEGEYPGLGVSIGYNAPGITVTIYLYDLEMESVPDNLDSPVLAGHFAEVVDEVLEAGRAGMYGNLQKTSETVVVFPSRQSDLGALCATFSMVQQGVERVSNLYLTAYRNHFLKIRFTYDRGVQVQAEDALDRLLAYIGSGMETGMAADSQAARPAKGLCFRRRIAKA